MEPGVGDGLEAVQSGTVGQALVRFVWLVSSVFGFLGPGWPPIILPGLWTLAWNPGDGIPGYHLVFKVLFGGGRFLIWVP